MLNLISILVGVVAALLLIPALVPLLGWLNWLVIPIAIVGLAIGALSSGKAGRNLNLIVIIIGAVRLFMGGGLL